MQTVADMAIPCAHRLLKGCTRSGRDPSPVRCSQLQSEPLPSCTTELGRGFQRPCSATISGGMLPRCHSFASAFSASSRSTVAVILAAAQALVLYTIADAVMHAPLGLRPSPASRGSSSSSIFPSVHHFFSCLPASASGSGLAPSSPLRPSARKTVSLSRYRKACAPYMRRRKSGM